MDPSAVVDTIMRRSGPVRLVAIDGPGGAGKSSLAARLAVAAGDAPVVRTDDFASWADPLGWWPRLLDQVVTPLSESRAARYQRYDWVSESLAEWCTVDPAPIVIIEGVSSGRREWRHHLAFLVWVEAPQEVRLARGIERDGPEAVATWQRWMAEEDAHFARGPTRQHADIVVDGTAGFGPDLAT